MRSLMACAVLSQLLAAGCGSAGLRTGGPYTAAQAPEEGLRYHVGRSAFRVNAVVVTNRAGAQWESRGDEAPCVTKLVAPAWKETNYEFSHLALPDTRETFRLGIVPVNRVEQALKVGVAPTELLTSFNFSGSDRTAEIVGTVLRGVAGVAGTFTGISTLASAVPVDFVTARPVGKPPTLFLPLNEHCYVNSGDPRAAVLARELFRVHSQREAALADQDRILRSAAETQSTSQLVRLRGQDSLTTRRVSLLTTQLAGARAALALEASSYAARNGVSVRSDTLLVRGIFDASELPHELKGTTVDHAAAELTRGGYSVTAEFLRNARLVVTLSAPVPAGTMPAVQHPQPDTTSFGCDDNEKDCARIRYRQPVPREIRIYSVSSDGGDARFVLRETLVLPVASAADPVLHLSFKPKTLADGTVTLAFGDFGNITALEQQSSARAAGAASTIASALTAARTEFVGGLQAVQTSQASVVSMRAAARSEHIKQLSDQKALLDAQIALDGARASRSLLEQKQLVDAQLAFLRAQQDLDAFSSSAAGTAELATIRLELERLKAEIELLQKQQELDRLLRQHSGGGSS